MLKKILFFVVSISMYMHIFSASSGNEAESGICNTTAYVTEAHFKECIDCAEEYAAEFTAKVGSTSNGTWTFTQAERILNGERYYDDLVYIKTDLYREIRYQVRHESGACFCLLESKEPIAPSESKHYCYDDRFTPEENRLLQYWVDKLCIKHFINTGRPVHRFRHMSVEDAKNALELLRFKRVLIDEQVGEKNYEAIYKTGYSLAQTEKNNSLFVHGYFMGKPLTPLQRPRSLEMVDFGWFADPIDDSVFEEACLSLKRERSESL